MYKCDVCNYIYHPNNGNPENGIKTGTDLEDLLSDWVCPV
ncbi:rubredoxin [Methanobacterium sp. MBAC-LM]|jgi:rubredoxin